jgi:hypothetical protein
VVNYQNIGGMRDGNEVTWHFSGAGVMRAVSGVIALL